MKIKIVGFGIIREIISKDQITLKIEKQSPLISDLYKKLISSYPDLLNIKSLAFAINDEYALPEDQLSNDDVVVIMPPVSGG
jgi:molybdopterin converting factor small subunit